MKTPIKFVHSSHPVLRQVAEPCTEKEMRELVTIMSELQAFARGPHKMRNDGVPLVNPRRGVALAGPQIGLSKRFFVWQFGIVFNPEILEYDPHLTVDMEGCLSFLDKPSVSVTRPRAIRARYYDQNIRIVEKHMTGKPARIFQHEFDHLNGKVIY